MMRHTEAREVLDQFVKRRYINTIFVEYNIMGFLDNNGLVARITYLNVLYGLMTLLSSLVAASLNAPFGADDEARYKQCQLGGVDAQTADGCLALNADSDEETQNETLFAIALSAAILNGILFAWSFLNHGFQEIGVPESERTGCGTALHTRLEGVFSLVNIGLFAGLVGWFNLTEFADDAAYEANLENNIFYSDYNLRTVALIGLIGGVLDFVGFQTLNMLVFKGRCDVK
tara:strand:- start:8707 stop:9399 length:693 start_codon:yes stop_codon:yes gene_type:complete